MNAILAVFGLGGGELIIVLGAVLISLIMLVVVLVEFKIIS